MLHSYHSNSDVYAHIIGSLSEGEEKLIETMTMAVSMTTMLLNLMLMILSILSVTMVTQ